MTFDLAPLDGTVLSPPGSPAQGSTLLAGDADRQEAVSLLQAAFVDGRLTKDDFDARVTAALTGRTYAQLAHAIRDLPGPVPGAGPGFGAAPALALPAPGLARTARALVLCIPAVLGAFGLIGHSASAWALHHHQSAPNAVFIAIVVSIDIALLASVLRSSRAKAPGQ